MFRTKMAFLALTFLALAGCGGTGSDGMAKGTTGPLTVADWKLLPTDQKYTAETLERLKLGDPNLETAEGWEAFGKTTLAEAKRKDFPKGKK